MGVDGGVDRGVDPATKESIARIPPWMGKDAMFFVHL